MHAVVQLPTFLADAKAAGVEEDELAEIAATIARDPQAGDVIPGTGGARKIRIAAKGKGKSGGHRVISYYAAEDVPVFLLALVSKGQRADIGQAARNELRKNLGALAEAYRAGVRAKVRQIKGRE